MEKQKDRNAVIAATKAELEASTRWMENVPLDCDPLDIVRHKTIMQFWPDRIQRLVKDRS